MGKYWKLKDPNWNNYQYSVFINGILEHKFGLPGVECKICDDAWGTSRVLPVRYYDELSDINELRDRKPISVKKNQALRRKLQSFYKEKGFSVEFLPGDSFLPGVLKLLSKPRYSILWPLMGGIVVDQKVKDIFENNNISGVVFSEVYIETVGNYEPSDSMDHLKDIDYPDDVFRMIETVSNPQEYAPLYEMIVTAESNMPKHIKILNKCDVCGNVETENSEYDYSKIADIIPQEDIFLLAKTFYIIINERVKKIMEDSRFTNVNFEELC